MDKMKLEASNMRVPTLGEMRPFLSRVARYSICMQETLDYENYRFLTDVPEEYDPLYIYGIGMTETEFYEHREDALDGDPYDDPSGNLRMSESTDWRPHLRFRDAIELVLSKEPRKEQ